MKDIQFFEKDCTKPECNPPHGRPHIHFKIVAHVGDRILSNGVRLEGPANVESRLYAKELLKSWLNEQT